MSILGRGLSSLIPRRYEEDPEDILEQIDNMDEEAAEETVSEVAPQKRLTITDEDAEETTEVTTPAPIEEEAPETTPEIATPAATATSDLRQGLDDFEELGEMEATPMPAKPLVTPLQIDPETGTLRDPNEIRAEATAQPTIKGVVAAEIVKRVQSKRVVITPLTAEEPTPVPAPTAPEPTPAAVPEVPVEPATQPAEPVAPVEATPVVEEPKPVTQAKPNVVVPKKMPAVTAIKKQRIENEVWDRHEERVEIVSIGDIQVNPNQPRRTFNPEELEELKQSIDQHGILQPLVVLRKGDHYELVAGERRLRAAKMLGWDKVPCVVRTDIHTDRNSLELALIENIQRENLNPIEEAMGYKLLNEEYGMSHEEIGQRVGRSRVNITNVIRILQLPAEIQRGLIEGKLTVGHARAILMIPDEEKQLRFYNHMLEEGLTVRKAETRARRIQRQMKINDPMRKKVRGRPQLALKYDGMLEEKFGHVARVKFNETKNRFEVFFLAFSEKEAEDLINRLLGEQSPAVDYPEDQDETEI